jgi:hypothetical protein
LTKRVLVLLLAVLIVLSGCNQPPKKRKFNNNIARANQQLSSKGRAFYKAIHPIGKGEAIQASSARSALNDIEKYVAELNKEYGSMPPPTGSPKGAALMEKYRNFLKTQQAIVDSCLKPIVAAIENPRLGSPAEKWAVISPLLKKADELESVSYNVLSHAQKDYANEHKFTLVQ